MRSPAPLAAALALAACATPAPAPPTAPPVNPAGGTCNAARVQGHLGETASSALGPVLLREAGARSLRWIAQGSAVTMDYSEQRLNAEYDAAMKITRLSCG